MGRGRKKTGIKMKNRKNQAKKKVRAKKKRDTVRKARIRA
jgi:hypothetical protein